MHASFLFSKAATHHVALGVSKRQSRDLSFDAIRDTLCDARYPRLYIAAVLYREIRR